MQRKLPLLTLVGILLVAACTDLSTLRADHPLNPVLDYEKMIVGRLDADYVGNEQCLVKCHAHDKIRSDFNMSVHGEQVAAESGLPLVNCESCHGPGSLAVAELATTASGDPRCRFEMLLPLEEIPAQAQSLVCLKCHTAASTANLHNWNSGAHASADVSCFDCHKLHQGPQQKASREEMANLCYGCHQQMRMQFNQFSHHPVPEHKMVCADCHEPHGSVQDALLRDQSVKATCTRCHMEYQGPFVYEHADVTENCASCHKPHGSPNNPLLAVAQPFLCMQCHAGHHGRSDRSPRGTLANGEMKATFFTRCTDCHSAIHGTDIPSAHGRGSFIAR